MCCVTLPFETICSRESILLWLKISSNGQCWFDYVWLHFKIFSKYFSSLRKITRICTCVPLSLISQTIDVAFLPVKVSFFLFLFHIVYLCCNTFRDSTVWTCRREDFSFSADPPHEKKPQNLKLFKEKFEFEFECRKEPPTPPQLKLLWLWIRVPEAQSPPPPSKLTLLFLNLSSRVPRKNSDVKTHTLNDK